jgi:hypothetical protein
VTLFASLHEHRLGNTLLESFICDVAANARDEEEKREGNEEEMEERPRPAPLIIRLSSQSTRSISMPDEKGEGGGGRRGTGSLQATCLQMAPPAVPTAIRHLLTAQLLLQTACQRSPKPCARCCACFCLTTGIALVFQIFEMLHAKNGAKMLLCA